MSKKVTLHVTDDDAPIVERFKAAGGNLSELLRQQLDRWARLEKLRGDHELIELEMEDRPNVTFYGTWIWTRTRDDYGEGPLAEGVAETRKGKFLHYEAEIPTYRIYESVDDIEKLSARRWTERAITDASAPEFMDI